MSEEAKPTTKVATRETRERPQRVIRPSVDALRPIGPLDIPESWKEEGYEYRWANAKLKKDKRIKFMKERGWEFALDPEGNHITAGDNDFLMKMPEDLFEEWEEVRREKKAIMSYAREHGQNLPTNADPRLYNKTLNVK